MQWPICCFLIHQLVLAFHTQILHLIEELVTKEQVPSPNYFTHTHTHINKSIL